MIKKIIFTVVVALFVVFLGMQFDRPQRNSSNEQSRHLSTLYPIPEDVSDILTVACYDCHSNNTRYPWYAEIQPAGKFLQQHIIDGKKELNFSEFASYRARRQYHKMEEIKEMIEENEMPLPSYIIMHNDAVLSTDQKNLLFSWVQATKDSMKQLFHPDSLKARQR